ncbi:MAG: two-component system response regulator [Roseateles depolymerans]|uniref:Two-component system response regulator n=1 Tax=Roseateles depolymerans TaxID=76731 RepID=A0A2W5DKU4_9BURK|nr:MAG: two-component system response regulator [Roseateles depolymerans]
MSYAPAAQLSDPRPTILVVDDSPEVLMAVSALLAEHYVVKVATRGARALQMLAEGAVIDLVLLDMLMPEMDGAEVLRRIRADEQGRVLPVLFLTAQAEDAAEAHGLELGAADYIRKPINGTVLLARVRTQLELKAARDILARRNEDLETEVQRRTEENSRIQDITIRALAALAEARDQETGLHILRTQTYVRMLAERLAELPKYRDELTGRYIELLYKCAPLHDIGKVGIPDRILLKPARLTPDEFSVMKQHSAIGRHSIENAEIGIGVSAEFLRVAKEIAGSHHERWDGQGYPEGLLGEAIPLSARLMSLADVYDALYSRRVYKEAIPHREVVQLILDGRGSQFDPEVVDAFVALQDEFQVVAQRYADPH